MARVSTGHVDSVASERRCKMDHGVGEFPGTNLPGPARITKIYDVFHLETQRQKNGMHHQKILS